jgi:sigma-B regulation protein RsbU (phosphoserine phosphatase)
MATMETEPLVQIRDTLVEKREAIEEWLRTAPPARRTIEAGPAGEEAVRQHLHVVETAVEQASAATLGICTVCQGQIEPELLEMDYTACVCLEDLSPEQLRGLEAELELAQSVQRSLLPQQVPDTPFLEIAAFSRPAQIVGGDYFAFLRFQNGADALAIADVAGHGISASLHMASVHALLHTLVPGTNSPADVLQRVHRLFIHNVRFPTFVTIFLGMVDPAARALHYCNAGHNPPLLLSGAQRGEVAAHWLWPTSSAIGLVETPPFGVGSLPAEPGDLLVLYTDGVTEAMNEQGEQFGRDRLERAVRPAVWDSARDVVHEIRRELEGFVGGRPLDDDTTIVACKIAGQ